MFESYEPKMFKMLREQKKLKSLMTQKISASFTPESCKEWEHKLEVYSYGQLEDLPIIFLDSQIDEAKDDDC